MRHRMQTKIRYGNDYTSIQMNTELIIWTSEMTKIDLNLFLSFL